MSGRLALIILPVALLCGTTGFSQPCIEEVEQQYVVDDPTNWDCENAMRLCSDTRFTFMNSDHGQGCLYFYFVLDQTDPVNIVATGSTGDRVEFTTNMNSEVDKCEFLPAPIGCPPQQALSLATCSISAGPNLVFLVWDPANSVTGILKVDVIQGVEPCESPLCCDCLPSFQPTPGREYVVSAWCKLEEADPSVSSYEGPSIEVFTPLSTVALVTVHPEGPIIDGWQRMEQQFTLPALAEDLSLNLTCTDCSALFDDVRYFPALSSMKCTVYDPFTLRLDAELDERHYATFYEYDGEGKLVRIKKETERGIMTIQETRYNTSKLSQ